jgi:hypothetical protein
MVEQAVDKIKALECWAAFTRRKQSRKMLIDGGEQAGGTRYILHGPDGLVILVRHAGRIGGSGRGKGAELGAVEPGFASARSLPDWWRRPVL